MYLFLTPHTTNPQNLPHHRLIQHPAFGFHHREPIAGAGDASVDQLAGDDWVGRLR
ncbi:hypothetical protein HAL1_20570 [Halomonas sp. HAL1]|nr:hypothetical protein HAL1_20570 [Halomonas sp. HAL1]